MTKRKRPKAITVRFNYADAHRLGAGPVLHNVLPLHDTGCHGSWISTEDALRAWNGGSK